MDSDDSVIIVQNPDSGDADNVQDEKALIEAAWKDETGNATKLLVERSNSFKKVILVIKFNISRPTLSKRQNCNQIGYQLKF